ncbi:MAG: hypothetical protein ACHQYP_05965 [Nitrospiria bacterium]
MNWIWDITLYKMKDATFKVMIKNGEHFKKVTGQGKTPHLAYQDAENKLVIKPWLKSEEG